MRNTSLLSTTRLRRAAVTAVFRQQWPAVGGGAASQPVPVPLPPASARRRPLVAAAGGILVLLLRSERGTRQRLTELGAHKTTVSLWPQPISS